MHTTPSTSRLNITGTCPTLRGALHNSLPFSKRLVLLLVLGVLGLWLCVFLFGIKQTGLPWDAPLGQLGLFGDFFGVVNSLFSAFAMSGAILALSLQIWSTNAQKQHDMDMLRRQKLEQIATLHFGTMKGLGDIAIGLPELYKNGTKDKDNISRFRQVMGPICEGNYELFVLNQLYFAGMKELETKELFDVAVVTRFDQFAHSQTTEEAKHTYDAFVAALGTVLDESTACLSFIIQNTEKIINQAPCANRTAKR